MKAISKKFIHINQVKYLIIDEFDFTLTKFKFPNRLEPGDTQEQKYDVARVIEHIP